MAADARERLADVMNQRRLDLGLKWREVAERSGMTAFHLQRIRANQVPLSQDAEAGIQRALRWRRGSITAVLAGGEPILDDDVPPTAGPPAGIDPKEWARWEQIDRENVLNAIRIAKARAGVNQVSQTARQERTA